MEERVLPEYGGGSALHRRLNDAGESSVRFRTADALRPVRKLAGNCGRTHGR